MPRINGVMNLTDGERTGNDICSQQALAGVNVSANLFDNILSDVANEITNSIASDGSTVLQGNLKMGNNKIVNLTTGTDATDGVNLSQVQALLESLVPAGTIIMTGQDTVSPPTGWLYCDGQTLSTTTYARLFSAIGTNFGTGGAGTFKLPDLRQRFPLGKAGGTGVTGGTIGETGGVIDHTHIGGAHTHTMAHTHTHGNLSAMIGFSTADSQLGAIRNGSITFGAPGATHFDTSHDVLTGGTGYTLGATTPVVPSTPVVGTTDGASTSTTSTSGSVSTDDNNPPYCTVNFIIKT